MITTPQLNNKALEILFFKLTFSEEELKKFLALEEKTLTQDLIKIIN